VVHEGNAGTVARNPLEQYSLFQRSEVPDPDGAIDGVSDGADGQPVTIPRKGDVSTGCETGI
jgi:hypothetical protein